MTKMTKVFFVVITIFCIFLAFVYYAALMYDYDCFIDVAKDYCEGSNMVFEGAYGIMFKCELEYDEREMLRPELKKFYFLDSEKDSCILKESWSWNKKEQKHTLYVGTDNGNPIEEWRGNLA